MPAPAGKANFLRAHRTPGARGEIAGAARAALAHRTVVRADIAATEDSLFYDLDVSAPTVDDNQGVWADSGQDCVLSYRY
jgi:hypothetical protein